VKKLSDRSRPPTRSDFVYLAKTCLYRPRVPILEWGTPYFKERHDLVADLIAGLTVAVMLIPQSMAYALLANLPPVYGMYTALWAPAMYALFGTSKHLQIGPTSLVRRVKQSGVN
jgi:sulfate permease, SulP family